MQHFLRAVNKQKTELLMQETAVIMILDGINSAKEVILSVYLFVSKITQNVMNGF